MRKVLNAITRLGAVVVLGFALTACGGQTSPQPAPEPTVAQPSPEDGQLCVTSTITIEYRDGSQESFTADLLRSETSPFRYTASVIIRDEDGKLLEHTSLAVIYDLGNRFSGSGSKAVRIAGVPNLIIREFTVVGVERHQRC